MDDSELPYNFRNTIASSFLFGIAETPTDEKKTQKIRQMSWLRSAKKKKMKGKTSINAHEEGHVVSKLTKSRLTKTAQRAEESSPPAAPLRRPQG